MAMVTVVVAVVAVVMAMVTVVVAVVMAMVTVVVAVVMGGSCGCFSSTVVLRWLW